MEMTPYDAINLLQPQNKGLILSLPHIYRKNLCKLIGALASENKTLREANNVARELVSAKLSESHDAFINQAELFVRYRETGAKEPLVGASR
jgi:hypothetical protein